MTIERIDPDKRWSEAVIHNNVVYYTSVPDNLDADIIAQTANTLSAIDILYNAWVLTKVKSLMQRFSLLTKPILRE